MNRYFVHRSGFGNGLVWTPHLKCVVYDTETGLAYGLHIDHTTIPIQGLAISTCESYCGPRKSDWLELASLEEVDSHYQTIRYANPLLPPLPLPESKMHRHTRAIVLRDLSGHIAHPDDLHASEEHLLTIALERANQRIAALERDARRLAAQTECETCRQRYHVNNAETRYYTVIYGATNFPTT